MYGPPIVAPFLLHCSLVGRIWIDDWYGVVLPTDGPTKLLGGVALVADHVVGIELAIGIAGLLEQGCGLADIVDVTGSDVYGDRQFVLDTDEGVELVAPDVLLPAVGAGLDTPTGVGVRQLPFLRLAPFDHALRSEASMATDSP